ncbi:late cornified envelope-like proline-rich protein 1 [Panicum miliaceum]|uniref:Late cornified envelope-like proline-rich protein 1 n=1 Tax=Panicum miliaceum TaxID=4540 RepID=A0A3L6SJ57_PANMI|nr:late cornified envelope-like proline-rich protein 1 [Panicum miliaceum]
MKIVLKVAITCKKCKTCVLGISSKIKGIKSLTYDDEKSTLTVVGEVDVVEIVAALRKAKHPAEAGAGLMMGFPVLTRLDKKAGSKENDRQVG